MKKIIINAGHHLADSGVVHKRLIESEMTIALRDKVAILLEDYGKLYIIPDHLNLRQSIAWVNGRADVDSLAITIHFNSHNNRSIGGTEVYYANEREHELAIIFADHVSKSGVFRNRGAKHDSLTWVGSLGWLRKLKCDSVLIEVCFLTNEDDMEKYSANNVSRAIRDAVEEVIPLQDELPTREELERELKESQTLVGQLMHYIINYLNKYI